MPIYYCFLSVPKPKLLVIGGKVGGRPVNTVEFGNEGAGFINVASLREPIWYFQKQK